MYECVTGSTHFHITDASNHKATKNSSTAIVNFIYVKLCNTGDQMLLSYALSVTTAAVNINTKVSHWGNQAISVCKSKVKYVDLYSASS